MVIKYTNTKTKRLFLFSPYALFYEWNKVIFPPEEKKKNKKIPNEIIIHMFI